MLRAISLLTVGVGVYLLWNNRFQIQRILSSYGIDTPLDKTNVINTVKSGVARGVGKVEQGIHSLKNDEHKVEKTA